MLILSYYLNKMNNQNNNQILNAENLNQVVINNLMIGPQNSLTINQCIQLASELRIYGYLQLSLQLYQDLIQIMPHDHSLIAMKGLTLLKSEQFTQSIQCMQKAMSLTKNQLQKLNYLLLKADALYASQKYNKALIIYSEILAKYLQIDKRKLSELYYRKGLCFMAKGSSKKAIQQFQSSILKNYQNGQAHMMKANCLFLLKQFKKSIRHFNYAVIYGLGQNIDLLSMKGLSHYNLEEYEKAKICFDNAIDLDQANTKYLKFYLTLIKLKENKQL